MEKEFSPQLQRSVMSMLAATNELIVRFEDNHLNKFPDLALPMLLVLQQVRKASIFIRVRIKVNDNSTNITSQDNKLA